MTDDARQGFDRRDFMLATFVAAGATAAIASGSGTATAQETATLPGGTAFTGDVIDGKPVVTDLNIEDLEPGKNHLLYFRGVQAPGGHHWLVSVMVARGARPGKRITLTSGVHGDEMSSIRTVQSVMAQLDPTAMAGSVMAVFDISRPALEGMARRWPNSGRGVDLVDLNRAWPGNENAPSAPHRHAGLVFNRLLKPNSDYALDFHTGTTGFDVTAFNIANLSLPEVRAMAELFPVQQLFDSDIYPGVLANAFIDAGIPALTPEVGRARTLDPRKIADFVEGTLNVLKLHGVIGGAMGRTGADSGVTIGNGAAPVIATAGGLVEMLVELGGTVAAGQTVAVQYDMFGTVVAEYTSTVDGEIGGLRSDATSEPGNPLMFILFNAPAPPKDAAALVE